MVTRVAAINSLNRYSGTKRRDTDQMAEDFFTAGRIKLDEHPSPFTFTAGTSLSIGYSKYIIKVKRELSIGNDSSNAEFSVVFHVVVPEVINYSGDGYFIARVRDSVIDSQITSDDGTTEGSIEFISGSSLTDVDSAVSGDHYVVIGQVLGESFIESDLSTLDLHGADIDMQKGLIKNVGDAEHNSDAVNLGQVNDLLADGFSNVDLGCVDSLGISSASQYTLPDTAPVPTFVSDLSNAIENGTWQFVYTWEYATGETTESPAAQFVLSGAGHVNLQIPDASLIDSDITGYSIYAAYVDGDNVFRKYGSGNVSTTTYNFQKVEQDYSIQFNPLSKNFNTDVSGTNNGTISLVIANPLGVYGASGWRFNDGDTYTYSVAYGINTDVSPGIDSVTDFSIPETKTIPNSNGTYTLRPYAFQLQFSGVHDYAIVLIDISTTSNNSENPSGKYLWYVNLENSTANYHLMANIGTIDNVNLNFSPIGGSAPNYNRFGNNAFPYSGSGIQILSNGEVLYDEIGPVPLPTSSVGGCLKIRSGLSDENWFISSQNISGLSRWGFAFTGGSNDAAFYLYRQ